MGSIYSAKVMLIKHKKSEHNTSIIKLRIKLHYIAVFIKPHNF